MGRGMKAGKKRKTGGASAKQQMAQMQAVQKQMEEVQAGIDEMEATASSGGGAVTVTVTGKKQVKEIKLEPEIVDPDDIEMLQDLIMTSVNEALRKMDDIAQAEMDKFTAGLGLPPGMI
ncbi:MAG: YbaB/EbfC family nucleoid-associated protein [Anaerovoracaceae bacterium]|jgi:DNA-binding YbaB/EbfC family protein